MFTIRREGELLRFCTSACEYICTLKRVQYMYISLIVGLQHLGMQVLSCIIWVYYLTDMQFGSRFFIEQYV